MKTRIVLMGVCALILGCPLATAADGPDPPGRTLTKARPGSTHPKASSFAPHHSRSHVYGDPISAPLLHNRKPARKPTPATPAK